MSIDTVKYMPFTELFFVKTQKYLPIERLWYIISIKNIRNGVLL